MLLNHCTHKTRTGGGFRTHRSRARCLNAVELHEQQQRTDTHIRTHRRNIRPTAGAQQRRRLRRDRGEPSRRACDRIAPAAASPDGLAAAQRTAARRVAIPSTSSVGRGAATSAAAAAASCSLSGLAPRETAPPRRPPAAAPRRRQPPRGCRRTLRRPSAAAAAARRPPRPERPRRPRRSTLASPAARTRSGAPFRSPERPATAHAAVSSSFRRMMTGAPSGKGRCERESGGRGHAHVGRLLCSESVHGHRRAVPHHIDEDGLAIGPASAPPRRNKCAQPATWVRTCG